MGKKRFQISWKINHGGLQQITRRKPRFGPWMTALFEARRNRVKAATEHQVLYGFRRVFCPRLLEWADLHLRVLVYLIKNSLGVAHCERKISGS